MSESSESWVPNAGVNLGENTERENAPEDVKVKSAEGDETTFIAYLLRKSAEGGSGIVEPSVSQGIRDQFRVVCANFPNKVMAFANLTAEDAYEQYKNIIDEIQN